MFAWQHICENVKEKKSKEQDLCDQFILFPHVYFFFLEKYRSFFIRRKKEKSILHTRSDKEKKKFLCLYTPEMLEPHTFMYGFFLYIRGVKKKEKK